MDEVEATNVLLDHGADIHKMAKQVNVSVKTPISPNLPPCHQHALTAMEVGGRNCGVRQARGLALRTLLQTRSVVGSVGVWLITTALIAL